MKKVGENKKKGGQGIVLLMYLLVGVACGLAIMKVRSVNETGDIPYVSFFLIMLIFIYLVFFVHIAVHEAGHLLFGLLTGYKFLSYRIANLMWIKLDGKIRFKRMSLAGTGGQCLMIPPDVVDGKYPYFWYNAGGCIANTVLSVICLLLYFAFKDFTYLGGALLMFFVVGIGSAFINGVPLVKSSVSNDGGNIALIRKSDEAMRSFWLQLTINAELSKGIRYKDMPDEWFCVPNENEMGNKITATLAVLYSNRLIDEHKFEEAGSFIDRLQDANANFHMIEYCMITGDRIYCELIGNNDTDKIKALQTAQFLSFMKQMKKNPSVLRTEYAYALIRENDELKAAKIKLVFDKIAASYPNESEIELERELIDIAHTRYYHIKCAENEAKL